MLPIPFTGPQGAISEKSLAIHHDKLYAGYVAKKEETQNLLSSLSDEDLNRGNQSYSLLRSLKDGENFAVNGVYLHEWYFENLGGDGQPSGAIIEAIRQNFGSTEKFLSVFAACGMAARGWVVLAWDTHDLALRIYTSDAHNHGGVWGAIPLLVLDVYEHAYFIDYGSDRKTYIQDFLNHLNWKIINDRYLKSQV